MMKMSDRLAALRVGDTDADGPLTTEVIGQFPRT
jgi:hypothetical protein